MESSILHPEVAHSAYFRKFIQQLAQKFEPLQVIGFSKNSHISYEQSPFKEDKVSFHCNYCLLLVTENATRIDYEVQDFANAHYQQGLVTIICHGKEVILEAVKANSRFFISVLSFGKQIYSKDGMLNVDSIPSFVPINGASKALKHYDHRMPLAEGFLMGAAECMVNECYGICTFMLHQAVEQICSGLIRVHIAYRSEFHNLHRLLRLCSCFSDRPYNLFLGTREDEKLFDVLVKSYSSARYKDDFFVSKEDAHTLYKRVVVFMELSRSMCKEKIEQMETQASQYRKPKVESEVSHEQI